MRLQALSHTMLLKNIATLCICFCGFVGCATDVATLEHFSKIYYKHSADKAHKFALKKAESNDLLWLIQAGISGFNAGSSDALSLLDQSESKFIAFEQEGLLASTFAQVGSTLVNDNAKDYRGNIYESVFVNYYKALTYLTQDDQTRARVEFNRANDRQRMAKEYYTKEISKTLEQEYDRYDQSDASKIIDRSASTEKVNDILVQHYSNLKHFRAFETFINPAVSYLSGLVFLLSEDAKGLNYLKEAYGVTRLSTIADDLEHFLTHRKQAYTWIIVEEGRQARKTELRVSLPLYTTQGLYHFGIALPQLESTQNYNQEYSLDSKKFAVLADIDSIIATEFEKQLKIISTRAIVSSSIKLAMQIGISNTLDEIDPLFGLLGSVLGSTYSMATTNADLRTTSVLPKRILLAKIAHKHPKTFQLTTSIRNTPIATLTLKQCSPNSQDSTETISANSRNPHIALCLERDSIVYIRDTPAKAYAHILRK